MSGSGVRQEELFFRSLLPELVTRRWGGSHLAGEAAGLFHYTFLHSQNVGGKHKRFGNSGREKVGRKRWRSNCLWGAQERCRRG